MSTITTETSSKSETAPGVPTLNSIDHVWKIVWPLFLIMALIFALGNTPMWGWQEGALAGIVAIQIFLFGSGVIEQRTRWSSPSWWPNLFYGVGLMLWVVQLQLSGFFDWVFWLFAGGLIMFQSPRISIPVTAACLLIEAVDDIGMLAFAQALSAPEQILPLLVEIAQDVFFFDGWPALLFMNMRYLYQVNDERGRLIDKLQNAQTRLEAARQQEIELATLRERERLARDLHDGLGHALTATSVQLEAIQRLYRIDPKRASAQIDELKTITRRSMAALRRSLEGLRTSGLGDRALSEALCQLIDELRQRSNLDIISQIPPIADTLTANLSEAIWRVSQEALTNVEKHADASQVQLNLDISDAELRLNIADDGIGLPSNAERQPGHYGLRGIRERIEALGGTLAIHSNSNSGTTIKACLPINKP